MGTCARCGGTAAEESSHPSDLIYAIGRVEVRFPSLAAEKEFAQMVGRAETADLTDRQSAAAVLSKREHRYLLRHVCFTFTIEGLDTYVLQPREPVDYDQLLDALRPAPSERDADVLIARRGPLAPPQMCNGMTLPIAFVEHLCPFDIESLIRSLPRPGKAATDVPLTEDFVGRVLHMTGNKGATDEHRALNYLVARSPSLYAEIAKALRQNNALASVQVLPSTLSDVRRIVEVVLSFQHRQTGVTEKLFARVDVTEVFPFLVSKLAPYYDR